MAEKFLQVDPKYFGTRRNAYSGPAKTDNALSRSAAESAKIAREHMHNVIAMVMKHCLFETQSSSAESDSDAMPADGEEPKAAASSDALSSVSSIIDVARDIEKQQQFVKST